MKDIAFETLEHAVREMECVGVGTDTIVHALVLQALEIAYRHLGQDAAEELVRNAVEQHITGIEDIIAEHLARSH